MNLHLTSEGQRIVSRSAKRLCAAALLLGAAATSQAAVIINITELANTVTAEASGSVNYYSNLLYTGYTGPVPAFSYSGNTAGGLFYTGATTGPLGLYIYRGITGPTTIGTGAFTPADSSTGEGIAVSNQPGGLELLVPQNYVAGSALGTSTATWNSKRITDLGLTYNSTFTWSWTDLSNNTDTITLYVGPDPTAAVSAPSTLALLCFSLGMAGYARKKSMKPRA